MNSRCQKVTVGRYINIGISFLHADNYSPARGILTEVPLVILLEKLGDYKCRLREDQIKRKNRNIQKILN